ncbi:hypothetical protein HAZELMIKA_44 [Klebsiella phage vB_KaeD_HazelMika]|uniref:Uncharacterized protein n=1 Tax=Escherichia phage vB_EcoS_NBD2 TaxID=1852563 RepID=A0A192Y7V9_9CAUD|nr:hypothetical protein BI040_gp40 [Escherichia phage vB_EcoS_NBD2]ANM45914.1 hypothetical protein NBD2_72 [Escherichia phage vB_EcoS_NBD2]UGO53134.1 hypothetical protein HAZELMIKA_44 [Klebsiella phage vB_KaeD_HazelMika]
MRNYSERQGLINEVIRYSAEHGLTEDQLNAALLSLINTSMRAGKKMEHTLCNQDGELILLVQRFK